MAISPREQVNKDISDFEAQHASALDLLQSKADPLRDVASFLERSWSGSFIGWHGRMYFRDFEIPSHHERFSGEWGDVHGLPDGWEEKDAIAVRTKINETMKGGFSIENFEDSVDRVRAALKELQKDIDLHLSGIAIPETSKAAEYVSELKSMTLGQPRVDFINGRLPKSNMSRDLEALRQGTCIPSWLYFEAVALEASESIEWLNKYKKTLGRLFQALDMDNPNTLGKTSLPQFGLHPEVTAKCASLYGSKEYAEAVEKSFKIVRDRLRKLTGHETGSEAFGKGKLFIKGASAPNVEADFNQAVKFLTMAIDMFRNEKSHTSDAKIDDPARAYQYLVMSSIAMYFLDQGEIRP